ncbi:hypothetical protein [Flavihumibacter sp. CACIAM 22H1]|nr:hypothetical protein [Flavihumibacter sp. CACIAM 22H1]
MLKAFTAGQAQTAGLFRSLSAAVPDTNDAQMSLVGNISVI